MGSAKVSEMRAALENGPMSVALYASAPMFDNYTGGIITADMPCWDGKKKADHVMVIVGYEVTEGTTVEVESYDHCPMVEEETTVWDKECYRASWWERRWEYCWGNNEYYERKKCCVYTERTETVEVRDPNCEPEMVEVVEDGMGVWVAQNSYGTDWGEGGFVRIEARDGDGVCGMNEWSQ